MRDSRFTVIALLQSIEKTLVEYNIIMDNG